MRRTADGRAVLLVLAPGAVFLSVTARLGGHAPGGRPAGRRTLELSGEAREGVAVPLVATVSALLHAVTYVGGVDAAGVGALELSRGAAEGGTRGRLVRPVAAIVLMFRYSLKYSMTCKTKNENIFVGQSEVHTSIEAVPVCRNATRTGYTSRTSDTRSGRTCS